VVRGEKAFFNTAQFQTNCAHEINALCQYYCKLCISVGFSKKGYGSFESPKGHGAFLKEYLRFCRDIVPAKAQCIAPKEGCTFAKEV